MPEQNCIKYPTLGAASNSSGLAIAIESKGKVRSHSNFERNWSRWSGERVKSNLAASFPPRIA
jgi:hypothetical protein